MNSLTALQAQSLALGEAQLDPATQVVVAAILRRVAFTAARQLFTVALTHTPTEAVAQELTRLGFQIVRRPRVERYDRFNTLLLSWRKNVE